MFAVTSQAVLSVSALLSALSALGLGFAGFWRSARAEDAKSSAEASAVGLEYLRESLRAQQETIIHQEGEIGALRGELKGCREERRAMADQIADLRKAIG